MVLSSDAICAESSSIVSVDSEIKEFDLAGEIWLKMFQVHSSDEHVNYSQHITSCCKQEGKTSVAFRCVLESYRTSSFRVRTSAKPIKFDVGQPSNL